MRPGDYDDKAYVWHDTDYAVEITNEALDFEATLEEAEKQIGSEGWPHEAVIEACGDQHVAYLTIYQYPVPENEGFGLPPSQAIYINHEQAEHLRDWLDQRLQERKNTHD